MALSTDKPKKRRNLDVTAEQIARTYAQGFLNASGSDAVAVEDLEAVSTEVLDAHPEFAEAMRSAFVDHEVRVGMIDRVLGGRVTSTVVNLMKVLSAHGRMELADEVARQARLLLDKQQGREAVLVRLAHAADDATLAEIEKTIRAIAGVEPVISVEIDPDLVGGLEIRVGDTVFDGTVRTAFAKAHKEIVEETVNAIENRPERFTLAD